MTSKRYAIIFLIAITFFAIAAFIGIHSFLNQTPDSHTPTSPFISIQVSISGLGVTNQEYLSVQDKNTITSILQKYSTQAIPWTGTDIEQMPDKIHLLVQESIQKQNKQYAVFLDNQGNQCLLFAESNQYSKLSPADYQALVDISRQGFQQDPKLEVRSGSNSITALGHFVYSYDKVQKISADSTRLKVEGVSAYVDYLPIDFAAEARTGTVPFRPYIDGKMVYGEYSIYNSRLEKLWFPKTSGLDPQSYIFHEAEPGNYIICLETTIETPTSQSGYQYFFGVTIPNSKGFAIYLTKNDVAPDKMEALSHVELADSPLIAEADIVSYSAQTHAIKLTDAAFQRLSQMTVPVSGKSFLVCVNKEPIYWGALWTPLSSASFSGVTILMPLGSAKEKTIEIGLGYPSPEFYRGQDPRSDSKILDALKKAGKMTN